MEVEAPAAQLCLTRHIVVPDSLPHDLKPLALLWDMTGRNKINRLLFVANSSPSLAGPALTLALAAIKALTLDTRLYEETYYLYRQFFNSMAEGKEQDPQALAWFEQVKDKQEQFDREWSDKTKRDVQSGLERLEVELKGYMTNLIKESIRVRARFSFYCFWPPCRTRQLIVDGFVMHRWATATSLASNTAWVTCKARSACTSRVAGTAQRASMSSRCASMAHTVTAARPQMPLAGPIQASLRRVGVQVQALQAALSELEERGLGCLTLLKAAKVLHDEYKVLASAALTTPRPAAPTRITAPTPAKNAAISITSTSKPTRDDATTPPSPPILTLETVDERLQSAMRPLQTDINTLKASLVAAAATPPTPPTTPPQPTKDNHDAGNRLFAEVAAIPTSLASWPRPSPIPASP
ncbi:hypothetical protein RTBOTA2_000807 [Rhodotorula toruloides]|nr:hypothetical protein RTBOTA2_000807 [Rhodotorula toruloides]